MAEILTPPPSKIQKPVNPKTNSGGKTVTK